MVSPRLSVPSPSVDSLEAKEAIKNIGRISLPGVQPLHLVEPRIFALDKGLFKEGMHLTDTHQVSRMDFEEFGRRIGLPERVTKREIDRFAQEHPLIDKLISRSFLSDALKREYRLSSGFRRMMLNY